jgi:hypothetical protein
MRYLRTQIYLDPEDHRRLVEEAHERGVSLAALIREIVSESRREQLGPSSRGFGDLIGIVREGPTDVAREADELRDAALEARLGKKLGDKGRPTAKPDKRRTR